MIERVVLWWRLTRVWLGRETEVADMINTFIKEGKIVPAEVTVSADRPLMDILTSLAWTCPRASVV
jgi:hypothetical protein